MHVVKESVILYNSNKLLFYLSKNVSMRFLLFYFFEYYFGSNGVSKGLLGPSLETPMLLSGNFGELRNNHFHSF
jgi:hypothetical protein